MWPLWLQLCYAILFLKFVGVEISIASETKSGTYRSIIIRSGACKKSSYRFHDDTPIKVNIEIYNTSTRSFLSRGDLNFSRNVVNMKVRIKSYIWLKGKWRMNHSVDRLGCKEVLIPMLCSIFNIKFDKKHCTFFKGNYRFVDLDMNTLSHLVARNLEYGRTLWIGEIYIPGKPFLTIFCQEYETLVVPA